MKTIDDIIESDKIIADALGIVFSSYPEDLQKSNFPKTSQFIFYLIKRIDKIYEGILAVAKTQNIYGLNILLRVLIEHYLTGMYVLERFKREKADLIGIEYYTYREREEELSYWDATQKQAKLIEIQDSIKELSQKMFEERFPYLKEISRSKLKDLNFQFKVNQIIEFFFKDVDFKRIPDDVDIPSLMLIEYYTDFVRLSSYVHCGPNAENDFKVQDISETSKSVVNICEYAHAIKHSFDAYGLISFWTMTFNKEYSFLGLKLRSLL